MNKIKHKKIKKIRKTKRLSQKKKAVSKNVVKATDRGQRYILDSSFEFFSELKSLILKASPAEKDLLIKKILTLGRIKLAVVSGIFLNTNMELCSNAVADLFIVGDDISKDRLRTFLRSLEAEVGREIKFSLMDREEFDYRFGMFDRFIRVLLEGPHEKIINKIGI